MTGLQPLAVPVPRCFLLLESQLLRFHPPSALSFIIWLNVLHVLCARPEVSVLADPPAWWHYAFAVVVEKLRAERGGRRYPDIVQRRRLR